MSRAYVEGLRKADPVTLAVLAQDLIRKPLVKLDPRSICDLIALGDSEKITGELMRDLRKFKDQMLREVSDLPDGVRLGDFLDDLMEVGPARIPYSLREVIIERAQSDVSPETVERCATLLEDFQSTEPDSVTVTDKPAVRVVKAPPKTGPSAPQMKVKGGAGLVLATPAKKSRVGTKATATPKDPARAAWIRDDVMERLSHYGAKGIKESILVAGAMHRTPFNDMAPPEIVSELKALKAAGRIDLKVGRWAVKAAW